MVFMYICTEIPGYILEPPVPIYIKQYECNDEQSGHDYLCLRCQEFYVPITEGQLLIF